MSLSIIRKKLTSFYWIPMYSNELLLIKIKFAVVLYENIAYLCNS
ncbi:hypothetical protein HMPREF9419_0746 [Prevotella nigrescens ATCC 33563]|nr:hypothetical protein HMPREF9419_0746 [Prevotella nigrescens ATCC 33563]